MRVLLLLLFISNLASAETTLRLLPEDWTVTGYASLRALQYQNDGGGSTETFGFNPDQNKFDFSEETVAGLQLNLPITDNLSGVWHVISKGSLDNFTPQTKWAYLKYQINDNYDISVGQMATPLFYRSQTEFIHYLHEGARMPRSIYGDIEYTDFDGIRLTTKHFLTDEIFLRTGWHYGKWDGDILIHIGDTDNFYPSKIRDSVSVNFELDWRNFKLFGGHLQARSTVIGLDDQLTVGLNPTFETLEVGALQRSDLVDSLDINNNDTRYSYFGFQYVYERWTIMSEFSDWVVRDSVDVPNQGWYTQLSYQIDQDNQVTFMIEELNQSFGDFDSLNGITDLISLNIGKELVQSVNSAVFQGYNLTWRREISHDCAVKVDYNWGTDERQTIGKYSQFTLGLDYIF